MSAIPDFGRNQPPLLRLFTAPTDVEPDVSSLPAGPLLWSGMSLSEFFDKWFLPVVLQGERNSSENTIKSYDESVQWWVQLTHDPGLLAIDEYTIATFQEGLRAATYRRGTTSQPRPLAAHTIAKHLKQVRAVLFRTGPTVDQSRPSKALLAQTPLVRVQQPRSRVKAHFPLATAQRIALAAEEIDWCRRRGKRSLPICPAPLWWRSMLSVLYYTGLRIGTVLKLRWSMVEEREGRTWLIVPDSIVRKTHKGVDKFLHPAVVATLGELRATLGSQERDLILPWAYSYSHLGKRHELLQRLAGVPQAKWLSPHAWRRTFGTQMARVGAGMGIEAARLALDHEDANTTRGSYVDLEPDLIVKLPPLLPASKPDTAQRRLFE